MSYIFTDVLLAIVGILASILIVLSIVGIGWFLVWKFFLSRFKFVRELLGTVAEAKPEPVAADPSHNTRQLRSRTRKARLD